MSAGNLSLNRRRSVAMAAIAAASGALLLATLPSPASAENYPPCSATRTDECTQSHHAGKAMLSSHPQKGHARKAKGADR
ncbi:hypothetical protein WBP07_22215 (plasmid) [Novosphingobium sp. BL-8A]|uniref:hypothetical protein n=1 Tax=Novosphingobium sp. BL-8A TaxID=3127639 RepID=UPI003757E5E9